MERGGICAGLRKKKTPNHRDQNADIMGATTPKDRAKNRTKTRQHVQHSMQEKWQKI
jgi:hypothetical protein